MANTVVAIDLNEGASPVTAILETTEAGQVAPNGDGYVLTASADSLWRYTFTVAEACVGIYRVTALDGDGLPVGLGYIWLEADDVGPYVADGSFHTLKALVELAQVIKSGDACTISRDGKTSIVYTKTRV